MRAHRRRLGVVAAVVAAACVLLVVPTAPRAATEPPSSPHATSSGLSLCAKPQSGVHCGPGNGRRTAGGGLTGKVSHRGWPAITGALLINDDQGRRAIGSVLNDEVLGGHGNDTLLGGAGKDVLWGDQYATGNNAWQHDVLWGGAGNDWIYPSHGSNRVFAGSGGDIIRAYYGHGSIDCGPGNDTAQVRMNSAYSLSNCEHVVHFCSHGSDGNGGCRKPGEPALRATRSGGQPTPR